MLRKTCTLLLVAVMVFSSATALFSQDRYRGRVASDRYATAVRSAARERMSDRDRDRASERAAYRAGQRRGYHTGVVASEIRNEIRREARRRHYRGVIIVRPHGHWYPGYGRYRNDSSAWKWLALPSLSRSSIT